MSTKRPPPLRPALLSTTTLRRQVGERADANPVLRTVVSVIENMAQVHDGLTGVMAVNDRRQTAEARALDLRGKIDQARQAAAKRLDGAILSIADRQAHLEADARQRAGLGADPAHGAEIRAALRAMPQRERDAAVAKAFAEGDTMVAASVLHAPTPLLTGAITAPVAVMARELIGRAAPENMAEIADLDAAAQSLTMAATSFSRGLDALRDRTAERRGDEGAEAAAEAERKLNAALAGAPPVEGA